MSQITKHSEVGQAPEVIEWMTECTLATIEYHLGMKRYSKSEVDRQCNIAQQGINWLTDNNCACTCRVDEVLSRFGGDVREWLKTRGI